MQTPPNPNRPNRPISALLQSLSASGLATAASAAVASGVRGGQALACCAILAAATPGGADAQIITGGAGGWSMRGTDPIEIYQGETLITSYHPGYEEGTPYFYPLVGPTGENLTRHFPMVEGHEDEQTDHAHHRGVWFSHGRVNGYDFWHTQPGADLTGKMRGTIRHRGMNGVTISGQDILFRVRSEWLAEGDEEKRLLSDRREFRLFHREDGSLVLDASFTLVADAGDVTFGDTKEGSFAIRLLPTLRTKGPVAGGRILNSEGEQDRAAWGKRAAWVDYSGKDRAGKAVGVAMFDHPENLNHPSWWHARDYGLFAVNPFGRGSFERDTEIGAGDFTLENGDEITLRYRLLLHPGLDEEAVAAAYSRYAGE